MKRFQTFLLASVAYWAICSTLELRADPPIPNKTQYSNRLQFRIPFTVKSGSTAEQSAQQFRLYVSQDLGKSWQLGESVAPSAGKFAFKAPADGEYWFIVRIVDAQGKLHPDLNSNNPGMKVIVDTQAPKLRLNLQQTSPGMVKLSWDASDEHLDPNQLKIHYLPPGTNEWKEIGILPKASGQFVWKVPQGGVVSVQGSIPDLANNVTTSKAECRIQPARDAVPRPGTPESRQPVAETDPEQRNPLAMQMPDRFPGNGLAPLENEDDHELDPNDRRFRGTRSQTASGTGGPAKGNFVSRHSDDRLASTSDTLPADQTSGVARSAVSRKRVVDSKRFQIGYNIEGVGPSGVSKVELYITDDDGATWYHYGSDDDNVSPIIVDVPREGTYGFALGVRSGAGLSSDPPRNGDPPSIVVVVDLTSPDLQLLPIQQGTGKNSNKLLITWKCSDDNLVDRPISLTYSATGKAPFEPIAGPLENNGSYVWSIPAGLPAKIVIRIEARDLAGHVKAVDSASPVVLDLARPTAKIIDVETPNPASIPR